MIPVVHKEVVEKKKWVTEEEFVDMLSVAQAIPGAWAVNIATFIGYKLRKNKGSLIAALGAILPSFLIILLIAMFFTQFQDNVWVNKAFKAIRPAVVALIAVPVFTTARQVKINAKTIIIPIAAAILISLFGVSPVYIILIAGIGGLIYGCFFDQPKKNRV